MQNSTRATGNENFVMIAFFLNHGSLALMRAQVDWAYKAIRSLTLSQQKSKRPLSKWARLEQV